MMIRTKAGPQVFLIMSLILLYPDYCLSNPREVILYPEAALVTEAKKVRLAASRERRTAVFILPAGALPRSLQVSLPPDSRFIIDDVNYQPHPGIHDERTREMKKQLSAAEDEKIRLRSTMAALEGQILFWQTQAKGKAKNNAEALVLSHSIARNLKKMHQEKMQLERDGELNVSRIKEIKGEIQRQEAKSETNWQVTVHLTGPPLTESTLIWTYLTRGCGWRPFYRLNALLAEKRIAVSIAAEVWQDTGQEWNQVNLTLATGEPSGESSAAGAAPWTIKALPETKLAKARIIDDKRAIQRATHPDTGRTVLKWPGDHGISLGARTVPCQLKLKIPLGEENWPAEFVHRLRPSQAAQAILTGFTTLSGGQAYPEGDAGYFVDGSFWRKGTFSFAGQSAEIEFGADPQVLIATRRFFEKPEIAGDGGDSIKVQRWHWITGIHNQRNLTIRLRLEENLPQFPDKRISGAINHEPPPDEQTPTEVAWRRDIPPREKITFTGGLIVKMPPQLEVPLEIRP